MNRSTFKLVLFFTGLFLGSFQIGLAQVDNYEKNKKASKEAEAAYNEDLKKNPNSALPHWKYANVMAEFTFDEYKDAWKYYLKALDIDSTTADIYFDFSNYLAYRLDDINTAIVVCKKGLDFDPDNQKLKDNIDKFNGIIEKNNERVRLYAYDKTDQRFIEHTWPYTHITNFDSLIRIVSDKSSSFDYDKLLDRFNNGLAITHYEAYLLLIGYTQTEHYNPYDYNAIDNIYALANEGKIDEAILQGEELLKTNPLNPSLNRVLMYCFRKKGVQEKSEFYHQRILTVFNAMLFTGQGTCEKPYVAFWVKEEYNLVRYINLSPTGKQATVMCAGDWADKLETYTSLTDKNERIYFNITLIFNTFNK